MSFGLRVIHSDNSISVEKVLDELDINYREPGEPFAEYHRDSRRYSVVYILPEIQEDEVEDVESKIKNRMSDMYDIHDGSDGKIPTVVEIMKQ